MPILISLVIGFLIGSGIGFLVIWYLKAYVKTLEEEDDNFYLWAKRQEQKKHNDDNHSNRS